MEPTKLTWLRGVQGNIRCHFASTTRFREDTRTSCPEGPDGFDLIFAEKERSHDKARWSSCFERSGHEENKRPAYDLVLRLSVPRLHCPVRYLKRLSLSLSAKQWIRAREVLQMRSLAVSIADSRTGGVLAARPVWPV